MKIPFNVSDLISAISFLSHYRSSSDDIISHSESGISKALYNQMMNFSKEELESGESLDRNKTNLFHTILYVENAFLFSGLIKKKAFITSLHPHSQWFLENNPNPTLKFYEFIFHLESIVYRSYRGTRINNDNFLPYVFMFFNKNENSQTLTLFDKFYHQFKDTHLSGMIEQLLQSSNSPSPILDRLVSNIHQDGYNINQHFPLNRFLPESEKGKFFITSTNVPRIQTLLDYGFRFNHDYTYNNESLFFSIIQSERKDIINTIIPYLTSFEPTSLSKEEQKNIIEQHKSKSYYDLIKSSHLKLSLENNLEIKITDSKKVKI